MFAVFSVTLRLHELLWYINEAIDMPQTSPIRNELRSAFEETESLTLLAPEAILATDVNSLRDNVNILLSRASDRPGPYVGFAVDLHRC